MSTQTIAIPRLGIRFKKPKFPSGRTIWVTLWIAYIFNCVALLVRNTMVHPDLFNLIVFGPLIIFWTFMYRLFRRMREAYRQLEQPGHLPVTVTKLEWAILFLSWLTAIWFWFLP